MAWTIGIAYIHLFLFKEAFQSLYVKLVNILFVIWGLYIETVDLLIKSTIFFYVSRLLTIIKLIMKYEFYGTLVLQIICRKIMTFQLIIFK